MDVIAAVDIGGTKIAVAAVTFDGKILHRCESATEPERGFPHAETKIEAMLRSVLPLGDRFAGIGVACPGPLDPMTGMIGEVGTLPTWNRNSFVPYLDKAFGVTVAVENDADAATLAEARWGTAASCGSFLYVTISTGIGGGILFSGELYRGSGGAHPEFGHQIIQTDGPLCYCGSRGCWESLASGTAMVNWMREEEPSCGEISAHDICKLAQDGDALARRAVERESYYLGLGLANLVTMFTPEVIALGGGVMKSSTLLLEGALEVVRQVCTQVPPENTRITLASLGYDVGLLGAACAWLTRNSKDRERKEK